MLSEHVSPSNHSRRISTGIESLDLVLGGGLVPGAIVLFTGNPGAGKSTLLAQALGGLSWKNHGRLPQGFQNHWRENNRLQGLYVSGEEDPGQVAARHMRVGVPQGTTLILCTRSLEAFLEATQRHRPAVVVLDSLQTMAASYINRPAGSISQMKEVVSRTISLCKQMKIACFIIGHVNKDGEVAGPKAIEHLVDTAMEFQGDKKIGSLRILRCPMKNRLGSTSEIGVFDMTDRGMREVLSPSARLLENRAENCPGSIVVAAAEGSKSMLVEIQARVTKRGIGQKIITGFETSRVHLTAAILDILPPRPDIYLQLTGGIRITDTALDLGVAAALASSLLEKASSPTTLCFGEVALSGALTPVSHSSTRIIEAAALGFTRIVLPYATDLSTLSPSLRSSIEIVACSTLLEGVAEVLECSESAIRQPSMTMGPKPVKSSMKKRQTKEKL